MRSASAPRWRRRNVSDGFPAQTRNCKSPTCSQTPASHSTVLRISLQFNPQPLPTRRWNDERWRICAPKVRDRAESSITTAMHHAAGLASRWGALFGHMHRLVHSERFRCSTEETATLGSEYAQRENEANVFAATLLTPLDDFRAQIGGRRDRPNFDGLGACANRYDVSLIAATLRWLQYTSRRNVLAVSRDGFIL